MSSWNLGLLGAASVVLPSFELIQTVTSGFQDVTFTNLSSQSSKYRHLQLRVSIRATGGSEPLVMLINGATSGYAEHFVVGNGTSVTAGGSSGTLDLRYGTVPQTTNVFAGCVIDILDAFSTSKKKTIRAIYGVSAAGEYQNGFRSSLYDSTSSITSITIGTRGNAVLASGCRFSLYGIRG